MWYCSKRHPIYIALESFDKNPVKTDYVLNGVFPLLVMPSTF